MPDSGGFGFRPRKLGYLIVAVVLLYLGFTGVRNARIDALARAAMDKKADPAIVGKLASYRGARSADLLLLIAGAAPTEENRIAAIHALVNRKAAPLVSRLSELLLPQEPLALRQQVAHALYISGCPTECIKNVLYFEERMWHGARAAEDVQADPPKSMSEPERQLQDALDAVLMKNKSALGPVLAQVYGLTTDFPSSFAIQLVERLDLKEACPALVHTYLSVNDQVRNSPEYQEVSQAVQILQCSSPPPPR
jgi:hypothetical protein